MDERIEIVYSEQMIEGKVMGVRTHLAHWNQTQVAVGIQVRVVTGLLLLLGVVYR